MHPVLTRIGGANTTDTASSASNSHPGRGTSVAPPKLVQPPSTRGRSESAYLQARHNITRSSFEEAERAPRLYSVLR